MACCGPERIYRDQNLLKNIRKTDNLGINMNLKSNILNRENKNENFKCKFNSKRVVWEDNINELQTDSKYNEDKEAIKEIEKLEEKKRNKIKEVEILEKEYLAKCVRLLYMVQTHCHIKTENEVLFEKYGIKSGNVFLNEKNEEQKEEEKHQDLDINSVKSIKEEKKELVEA